MKGSPVLPALCSKRWRSLNSVPSAADWSVAWSGKQVHKVHPTACFAIRHSPAWRRCAWPCHPALGGWEVSGLREVDPMTEAGQTQPPSAGRITDTRGRRVTQLDPVALHLLRRHSVIEADVLRAIANEKGVKITRAERIPLIVGICGALLVITLFAHALITGDIRDAPYAKSAGLLYLCALPWIMWYALKKKRFREVAAAMLKYSRCPHCGYDLRMLPTDPRDGATVCPECGCAWKLEDASGAQAE